MTAYATDRVREPARDEQIPAEYMTALEASQRVNVPYDEIVQALESATLGGAMAYPHGWLVRESVLAHWQALRAAAVQGNG